MSRGDHGSRVPAICLGVFVVVWVALAIAPRYRADWLLENIPTFVAVPAVVWLHRRFPLSDRAWVQATIFAVLHTIGSHYTYSLVPLGEWVQEAVGSPRNQYDRVVHFSFGLLMLKAVTDLGFRPRRRPGPFGVAFFGVAGVALWSVVYEVLEWLVARVADPAAGTAFLGTQGDPWDAEKDMACALVGSIVAATAEWAAASRRRR